MEGWFAAHYDTLKDLSGPAISLLGLLATIVLAVIGFTTLGRWRRERVEGRRIEVAFEALEIAYKTKHVFEYIRSPLIEGYEWVDMPQVASDTDDIRSRRGSLYAIGKRVDANKDFFEEVWKCHAKCMAVFGPSAEEIFLELHKARQKIDIAIKMLIRHVDDAPIRPDPHADLWQQLRADLCGAEGELANDGDRVGRHLTAFKDGIEKLCRPVVDRTYGRQSRL